MQRPADDLELVSAFQGGTEAAFEELVRRYRNSVASFIVATIGRTPDLEDLSQEVFLRVHQALPHFRPAGSFGSWLYRITVNLCRDELRKRRLRRFLSLDAMEEADHLLKDPSARSDAGASENEQREVILAALRKIDSKYRTALVLREYEELSYAEIAKILGITQGAVKSRIFRARDQLRELLKGYFKERT